MSFDEQNILTIILAGGKGSRLYPLTRDRSKPAVYFAARYRIIDFALSNCLNSGLRKIYVITQYKSLSLEQHIRRGWNFLAPELSQFIATVPAQQRVSEQWYSGTADAIFQNMHLLEDHRPEHVIVLSGDHIYGMDYRELFAQHIAKQSDLTASVLTIDKSEASQFGVLSMNSDLEITDFIEKPEDPSMIPGKGDKCYINMGIYIFKTDALVRVLSQDARQSSAHDFGKNIIPNMLKNYKVNGFVFENSKFGHYWRDVGTIKSYYDANQDFLSQLKEQTVGTPEWPLSTQGTNLPPTYYGGHQQVEINNSSIALGCHLYNCKISNTLIGRNSVVESGSVIEDSILMPNCKVGKNCIIRKAIFDDGVSIPDNTQIGINPEEDQKQFFISDGIAVLPKHFKL